MTERLDLDSWPKPFEWSFDQAATDPIAPLIVAPLEASARDPWRPPIKPRVTRDRELDGDDFRPWMVDFGDRTDRFWTWPAAIEAVRGWYPRFDAAEPPIIDEPRWYVPSPETPDARVPNQLDEVTPVAPGVGGVLILDGSDIPIVLLDDMTDEDVIGWLEVLSTVQLQVAIARLDVYARAARIVSDQRERGTTTEPDDVG